MQYDNPAARLLAILENGRQQTNGQICRAVWDQLLKTNGDQALLMSRLGKLMELPQDILQAIDENYPSHRRHTTHWSSQINNAFLNQQLAGNWGSFNGYIDDHTLSYLAMTAELLEQKSNTKPIADEAILEVRSKIEEIYNDVLKGDYPSEIKLYLVRYLRQLLQSIDEYFLTGALPILDTTGTILGHALIDEQYRGFLRDEAIGTKIFECLTAMANVVSVAVGLPQLSAAISSLPPLLSK